MIGILKLKARKIVVTGGAGYIGSIVVEQLVARGEEVVVVDDLSTGHRAAVHPEAAFREGSLADRSFLNDVIGRYRPEAIMHFASNTLVGESMAHPFLYLRDNVVNGLNLFECAVKYGVRRLILSSTANLFYAPEQMPIRESELVIPGSPYGESKHVLERYLYWLDRLHGIRYAVLRYFNAAGASEARGEDHTPETHLLPIALEVAQGKRAHIVIHGDDYPTRDGSCIRDFIHVLDLAQAHILALDALEHGSRIYHLGSGQGFTIREVIDTVGEVTGRPIPIQIGPRRAGDPAVLVASNEKIRKELGWNPQHSALRSIIESAWRWHQSYPQGYEKNREIAPSVHVEPR